MVKNQKRPYTGGASAGTWFNAATVASGLGDAESDIPQNIYFLLEGGKEVAHHKAFTSFRAAEEAFWAAWRIWSR